MAKFGYVSLSDRLAEPYVPLPDGAAVAFGVTLEGIEVLRTLLLHVERSLREADVPSQEQA